MVFLFGWILVFEGLDDRRYSEEDKAWVRDRISKDMATEKTAPLPLILGILPGVPVPGFRLIPHLG